MLEMKRLLLSSRGLLLLASLLVPWAAPGCYSAPSDSSGAGGSSGSGGQASGSGGAMASGGATGSGGAVNGGTGGTTGGTGGKTVGSGGTTGGSGGAAVGSGGSTGPGGQTGAGGRGSGGSIGTGGSGTGGKGTGGTSAGSGGRTGALRIMPLGDSLTADTCYRSHLYQLLVAAGHANPSQFDLIGTRKGDPGCSFTGYDQDNEGHGGYLVSDVLKSPPGTRPGGADTTDPFDSSSKDLMTWFDGHPADVVLMHFGTNDLSNNISTATILSAYTAILTRLRANNPNVRMLVAQITPINWQYCYVATCGPRVMALNAAIPGWATTNSTAQSPISVVDQYTNFDVVADTTDGVHYTDSGAVKVATNWYNALAPLF